MITEMNGDSAAAPFADYRVLAAQVKAYLEEEPYYASALGNISALLMCSLEHLNWAGFYLMRGGRLVVGPFQGKPACIHIEMGEGVCGTSAATGRTIRVPDVHAFPGHIACDGASNSEIVIPLWQGGKVVGVMDLDSPLPGRFTETDQAGLEQIAREIEKEIIWKEPL